MAVLLGISAQIKKYSCPEIRSVGNCSLEKKSGDSPVPMDGAMQRDQRVRLTEVIWLQTRRSSSCVRLAAEAFFSWGAERVMGSGKVSRKLFFSFIGKYKPVGSVFDS